MTRDQLEHAIRIACAVSEDTELLIFGSQAILGEHPDTPADLRVSVEVDVQPKTDLKPWIRSMALGANYPCFTERMASTSTEFRSTRQSCQKDGKIELFQLWTSTPLKATLIIVWSPMTWRQAS